VPLFQDNGRLLPKCFRSGTLSKLLTSKPSSTQLPAREPVGGFVRGGVFFNRTTSRVRIVQIQGAEICRLAGGALAANVRRAIR
jgi:hypothetical protein